MTPSSKHRLRSLHKTQRQTHTPAERIDASVRISSSILAWPPYREAKCIAIYQAIQGEIDLSCIWKSALSEGKSCAFPAINEDQTLSFLPATASTVFAKNRFGIAEPTLPRTQALPPHLIDIIFLPLVAFDAHGTRLGMGGGYYDRTLADVRRRPPLLVGIAYDAQRQPLIEADAWDVPMDLVITERTMYWSKSCPIIG